MHLSLSLVLLFLVFYLGEGKDCEPRKCYGGGTCLNTKDAPKHKYSLVRKDGNIVWCNWRKRCGCYEKKRNLNGDSPSLPPRDNHCPSCVFHFHCWDCIKPCASGYWWECWACVIHHCRKCHLSCLWRKEEDANPLEEFILSSCNHVCPFPLVAASCTFVTGKRIVEDLPTYTYENVSDIDICQNKFTEHKSNDKNAWSFSRATQQCGIYNMKEACYRVQDSTGDAYGGNCAGQGCT